MSQHTNEITEKPTNGKPNDELKEQELEKVSGGSPINPQPLPPRRVRD